MLSFYNQYKTAKNAFISNQLESAAKESTTTTIDWPYTSDQAISEYSSTEHLFPKAFPWLFPGGYGDFAAYQEDKITIAEWCEKLLHYYDGRFAKDKMWGFFALNYTTRRMNQSSGGWFVNNWYKEGQKSLPEI